MRGLAAGGVCSVVSIASKPSTALLLLAALLEWMTDGVNLPSQTAEMPGFYQAGEYDVAGFAVGSVKQDAVIDGKRIAAGDVVLGMPSSGVHSNGFSLVRKVLEVRPMLHHARVPPGPC